MTRALILLGALVAIASAPQSVRAQDAALVINLSQEQIYMRADFSGETILLFGSIDTESAPVDEELHIAITLSGPERNFQLRRKQRAFGLWVNAPAIQRERWPSYYTLASSAPLSAIAPEVVREQGLGLAAFLDGDTPERRLAQVALLERQQERGFYNEHPRAVRIIRNQLFRAPLTIAAGAPSGSYNIGVYLIHRGRVIGQQNTQLRVVPAGLEHRLQQMARERPAIYGGLAILLALIWGVISTLLPRRRPV